MSKNLIPGISTIIQTPAGDIRVGTPVNYTNIDSVGKISQAGIARIAWTKYTAASVTITVGGTDATSIVDNLQTAHDGLFFHLDEVAAAPALDFYVEFTSITAINWVQILACYSGSATHAIGIQLYNWTGTPGWDTFNALQDSICDTTTVNGYIMCDYSFFVPADSAYIGTSAPNIGKVRVRFYHTMTGNNSHDFYADVVALYQ